jgi:hypothetical protein
MISAIKAKFFSPLESPWEVSTGNENDNEREEVEVDEEDGEEREEVEEIRQTSSDYILGTPRYETVVFDGILHRKYVTRASRFVPNVTGWVYNRSIDPTHVTSIQKDLLTMKNPHLIGSFKIVKTLDDSQPPKLLDGHHRRLALENILKQHERFDMDIDVDVYYVKDVENCDQEVRDLFIKANNNRNVDPRDIPDILVMLVVDRMISRWPKNIKVAEGKAAIRPNITKRDLVAHLKPILSHDSFSTHDADRVFQRIVEINNEIRLTPLIKLFGTTKPAARKMNCLKKAFESGFFLNMDCKNPIDVWAQSLLTELNPSH